MPDQPTTANRDRLGMLIHRALRSHLLAADVALDLPRRERITQDLVDAFAPELAAAWGEGYAEARKEVTAEADQAYWRGHELGRRQATEGKRLVVEWGARVDEPHPARHEKVGDVIKLGEPSARHAPTIWAGWTTVRRDRLVGPWEPAEQPEVEPAPVVVPLRWVRTRRGHWHCGTDEIGWCNEEDKPGMAPACMEDAAWKMASRERVLTGCRACHGPGACSVHAEPASGGVAEPSGPLTAEEATPDCVVPPTPDHDRVRSLQRALGGLAADGPIVLAGEIPALPETLTVHLDNRDARFVPADPPVPLFEGDEALPPEPGTCPFCGVHGTVRTVHLGEPSPPEGEALGVTDEHRHDFGKAIGDLRDRYGPRRQHDPGALIEEPDLYRPHAALNERGHLRGCGCEDCERDEQGEGDDRG